MTIGAIFIGCFFVSTVSENQVVSGLNTVAYFLAGFVLGIPIAWFFLSAGRITLRIMRHERLVNSGSYTGSTVSYNSNNKWDQERAERERQEREADQRAKARYDARTNQLKAEYDARTAAGWGKTGAERNFRNDADYPMLCALEVVDPETKEQAEAILNQLGIPMSNAIGMFLKQVVLHRGIPFDMRLPAAKPTAIGGMTKDQVDMELQKGMDDIAAGRVVSADEVEAEMRRLYGI